MSTYLYIYILYNKVNKMGVTFGVNSHEQIFHLLLYRNIDILYYILILNAGTNESIFFSFFFFFLFLLKIVVYVQRSTVVDFTGKLRFLLIVSLVLRVNWGVSEHR